MKKSFIIILTAVLICLSTACGNSVRTKLADTAEQINMELPMTLGNGVNLDIVTYNDDSNIIFFHYSLDEEYSTVSNLRGAHDSQRRFLRSYLSGQEGNEFARLVVDADAGICLEYTGLKSNDKVELTFYNNEIKDILSNQEAAEDERTQLANLIAISNDQCPIQISGEDLVMTGVILDNENIEFSYTYNPIAIDLDPAYIDQFKDAIWEGLKDELSAPANALQLELMKKTNTGVSYRFSAGDSITPITFSFPASEIQKL